MDDDVGPIMDDEEDEEEQTNLGSVSVPQTVEIVTAQQPKPAFAGLPIDDAADAWMDDDVAPIMDDDDNDNEDKQTVSASTTDLAPTDQGTSQPPKAAFAGLPIDDSADAWMDDDVGPIMDDEEDEEEQANLGSVSVPQTVEIVTAEQPKPAFAGLPIDDAADSWMDDDVGAMMESDEEDSKQDDSKEVLVFKADVPLKQDVTLPVCKPAFAGLPIDDAADAWMNDDVCPIMDSDDDKKETVTARKEEQTEEPKGKKKNNKKNKKERSPTKTKEPEIDENPKPKMEKPKRKDKTTKKEDTESKQETLPVKTELPSPSKSNIALKPDTKKQPVKETKTSNIDSILDDWLKGSEQDANDDTIPDELPDIDDVIDEKDKKDDIKSLKLKKINDVLSDMGHISNIIDKDSNKDVKNAVDDWFSGANDNTETSDSNTVEEKCIKPVVPLKEENVVPCGDCSVCGKLAKAICTGCKHVFYCTRDHQRKHWSSHKEECKAMAKLPYRVERSEAMGRYLTATKDLEEGELILNESPMVVGPRQLTKPVCLGCHKEITATTPFINCIRCNWPVCSEKCQDSPMHDSECRATKAAGSRIKVEHFDQINMMYACITILRAMALQDGPRKIWEDYTKFDSHLQERIKTPVYNKVNKEKVVFFIHHYLNIQRYSDLEILEACGKLDTNCFEIKQNGLNLRAMYRTACIMSHDCRPNTRHTFDPDNAINIYSTQTIKKGDIINATYTNSLWSTNDRREHLQMSKCFWCTCPRCTDPTEHNSYLSAIRCSRCAGFADHIQNKDLQFLLPEDPLNTESIWRCQKCTNVQKASQIKAGNMTVSNELKELDRSKISNMMNFLTKYENLLGPNNHHIVEIKFAIVMILANRKPYTLDNLTQEELELKERLAAQLIELADKIEPGSSKWKGQLLLELQMAQVALAAGLEETGAITRFAAKERATVAMENLRNSARILQVEPDMRPILQSRMEAISNMLAKWED